jgi:hypothetical protein
MRVFTNGKIESTEIPIKFKTLKIDANERNFQRSSFQWFDIGPPNIAKYGDSNVEVLAYRENKSKIISYVMVFDDMSGKLFIVDKKLLLND